MKVVIDRFEGDYAICEKEDRTMVDIEKNKIPVEAKEGDILLIEDNKIIINKEENIKREKKIEELTKDLWI